MYCKYVFDYKRPYELQNLNECTKIELPLSRFSASEFEKLENGALVAVLNFSGMVRYEGTFGGVQKRNATASLYILKDTKGFTLKNYPNNFDLNGEMSQNVWNTINASGICNTFIPYAKCFYVHEDHENDKLILYIVTYLEDDNLSYIFRRGCGRSTGVFMGDKERVGFWKLLNWYEAKRVEDIKCTSGYIPGEIRTYVSPNIRSRYLKKLDEVAWYSKLTNSELNAEWDPVDDESGNDFESYRRVKLKYDYSLAKGTTNSKGPDNGRLALRSVQVLAGDENNSSVLPPYTFSYQGTDANYIGHENLDVWGYRKTDLNALNNNSMEGVCWNLSEITFPSGGSMAIDYSRDHLKSIYGTIDLLMKTKVGCETRGTDLFFGNGAIDDNSWFNNSYEAGFQSDVDNAVKDFLKDGSKGVFIIPIQNTFPSKMESNFSDINLKVMPSENVWDLNGKWIVIRAYLKLVEPITCRHHLTTFGPYKVISVDAANKTIQLDQDVFDESWIGKNIFKRDRNTHELLDIGDNEYFTTDRVTDCNGGHHVGWQAAVLKDDLILWGGDLRVRQIETKSLSRKFITTYIYPPSGGTIERLPGLALPDFFNKRPGVYNTTANGLTMSRMVDCIRRSDFAANLEAQYNTGNSMVVYPYVKVIQLSEDAMNLSQPFGYTKYHFYTYNDKLTINGETGNDIIEEENISGTYNNKTISVKRIIDRSGIVGMPKKIEKFNKDDDLISTVKKKYAFSEEIPEKSGLIYGDLNTVIGNEKPLGMIRERSVRIDYADGDYKTKSIADVVLSKPFFVGVEETVDGVKARSTYGFFEANTGGPMLTLNFNSEDRHDFEWKRADFAIPYNYITNDHQKNELSKKNIFRLDGGSFTTNVTYLGITDPGDYIYKRFVEYSGLIKKASSNIYKEELFKDNVPFNQNRFWLQKKFVWEGIPNPDDLNSKFPFVWPSPGNTPDRWRQTSEILLVDRYCRPRTEFNALTPPVPRTIVYHPQMDAVTGVISNAKYHECNVYTGDYSYNDKQHPGYADYDNGWVLNAGNSNGIPDPIAEPCVLDKHFGNRALFVQNAFGPTCNFKVSKSKDYILSAWVKVTSGEITLNTEYRNATGSTEITNWPIRLDQLGTIYAIDDITKDSEDASDWTYVELKVNTKEKLSADIGYLRIWVGTPNGGQAYVDDIRFYPEDALTQTFYYDQELGTSIAMVDANNKAGYFEFDDFGRLVAVRNSEKHLLKKAEYHHNRETSFITVVSPNGGEEIEASHKYVIKWKYFEPIENAKVNILLGTNVGTNNETWEIVKDLYENRAINIPVANEQFNWWPNSRKKGNKCKIRIEVIGDDVQDLSDGVFSIYVDD